MSNEALDYFISDYITSTGKFKQLYYPATDCTATENANSRIMSDADLS